MPAADPGCEFVSDEALGLPEWPELGGFEFSLPALPRLLMPSVERLQTLETLEMLPPPQQSTQTHPTKAPVAGAAGVTVGAVGGVAVGAAIVWTLLFRKRTGDRVVIQHTR